MIAFLIADTFTDSLARLTGDEQKAVKTTAFEFQATRGTPLLEFDEDYSYFMVRLPVHPAALEVAEVAVGPESRPESRSESTGIWRTRPEWRPEWGSESVHDRVMVAIHARPLARSEIADAVGHKSITGGLRQALADLMEAGFVAYTRPDKPNSRLQKYRPTVPKAKP